MEGVNLKPESLQELIETLHILFATDKVNIEDVQAAMENYESNEDDWEKYAVFEHYRYTRNLVDEGNGRFDLMVLCWSEGQGSSIHSHSDAHCFMKVLDGTLKESTFAWPEESKKKNAMTQLASNTYERDQVAYINDSKGLHRVENPSHSDRAASLHLYSPPFQSCQCFDQRTGKSNTSMVTFWSKYGERTPYKPSRSTSVCPEPEPENN
ncbi:cysteine dioxygenase type 1 [Strongylocentrotus purpuratus]|uniref:Cysteine dioxygenase n=1 Tax=Strongylocentrotus purpuratus TaxID=7668 RepID=A0A7M7LWI5_STRPU|nr:cysteine dioxygenase type 1 [Strongylocentrotus purpuratus]|eukprot:XP_011680172.1 PREDICTED: cysteine dioxygenase type 1 isoform X1 [Strongylocentrotus purpuratus]